MVISRKVDYRKRKKRESFFGIPAIPLIIFLVLVASLILVLPIRDIDFGITGTVIDTISLTQTKYTPNDLLNGNLKINFKIGDRIPYNTNVTFEFSSIKCKDYYVCEDGFLVAWEKYDTTSGKCEEVNGWINGPWDECGETYSEYDCENYDKECYAASQGLGNFYENLVCDAGKECWDGSKITTKKILIDTITLSTTPWKGNYTQGPFKNMDGYDPPGSGYGFGACEGEQAQPVQPESMGNLIGIQTGYVVGSQPVTQPDLTVEDIFILDVARSNFLYTRIANLGGDSGSFTIVACWVEEVPSQPEQGITGNVVGISIPSNCFYSTVLSLESNQRLTLNLGQQNVAGKTVKVIVDYFNEVSESNENNNQMQRTFAEPSVECSDSDGGIIYDTRGTCTDRNGPHTDECLTSTLLKEWSCSNDICVGTKHECSFKCLNGACVEEVQVQPADLPDLIVTDIKRHNSGIIVYMKNIGTGSTFGPRSFYVKVTYRNLQWTNEYQIQNSGFAPGATFSLHVFNKDITGKAVDVVAFVDSSPLPNGVVDESNEKNNELSIWLSPYSCENWQNKYIISLSDLGIKAPQYDGAYEFKISLIYEGVTLTSSSDSFEVETEQYHRVCLDQQCVAVTGVGVDQCNTNSDCETACNENWQFVDLTECIDGIKQIECYDSANCGTTHNLPPGCMLVGDKYIKEESCCESQWDCSDWSVCYEYQGSMIQSMVCEDIYGCDPNKMSYTQLRDCCIEEWDCKWGPCIMGEQEKICKEINNCDTEFTKPESEIRSCQGLNIAWWVWIVLGVVFVAIILVILIGTKRLPGLKRKPSPGVEQPQPQPKKYSGVIKYIKKAREAGLTTQEIKKKLVDKGWPPKIVDDTFEST